VTTPTLPPRLTDADLDRPDVRDAARAVLDAVTADDLALMPAGTDAPGRRRPRLAVAAAAAAVALGAGTAGYALTAGGGPRAEPGVTAAPAAAPEQSAPSTPADVCAAVSAWLQADLEADADGADSSVAQLAAYEERALSGGDEELGARIEAFVSAALSGDRLAAESVASANFGGDACA
jgi:hypothetical protein